MDHADARRTCSIPVAEKLVIALIVLVRGHSVGATIEKKAPGREERGEFAFIARAARVGGASSSPATRAPPPAI